MSRLKAFIIPKSLERELRPWALLVSVFVIVLLALFGCTPVHAAPLTPEQRQLVEGIQARAREQKVQLDAALADQVGAHLALLDAQTAAVAARAAVDTLRAEKTATEERLIRTRILGFPVALIIGTVAGLLLSRLAAVAGFMARVGLKAAVL